MKIERISLDRIVDGGPNPRVDLQPGDARYADIKRSIDRWDSVQPLVWNVRTGHLVGGHQRLKILRARGDTDVMVSVVDLPAAEEIALNIALNKIEGAWDRPALLDALEGLQVPVELSGFAQDELLNLALELEREQRLFSPNLEPDIPSVVAEAVTAADVKQAADRQVSRFEARKVQDITCPHCGGVFGVGSK